MSLSVHNLRVSRGARHLTDHASFQLAPGEMIGVIGPNGVGKSTLLRTLAGQPDGGTQVDGTITLSVKDRTVDVRTAPRGSLAADISYLPQLLSSPFGHRVLDIVLMGGAHRRGALGFASSTDRTRARALLDQLGIGALADAPITGISGGERQRAYVAMQLIQDTPLLVLDEPTSAQDFQGVAAIAKALRARARAGSIVVAAVHDLNFAARAFDRLVMIRPTGTLDIDAPHAILTQANLSETYGAECTVHQIDGIPVVLPMPRADRN